MQFVKLKRKRNCSPRLKDCGEAPLRLKGRLELTGIKRLDTVGTIKKSPSPQLWILKLLHFFIKPTVILTYIEHLNSNQRARGWKEVRIRNYLGKGKRK